MRQSCTCEKMTWMEETTYIWIFLGYIFIVCLNLIVIPSILEFSKLKKNKTEYNDRSIINEI